MTWSRNPQIPNSTKTTSVSYKMDGMNEVLGQNLNLSVHPDEVARIFTGVVSEALELNQYMDCPIEEYLPLYFAQHTTPTKDVPGEAAENVQNRVPLGSMYQTPFRKPKATRKSLFNFDPRVEKNMKCDDKINSWYKKLDIAETIDKDTCVPVPLGYVSTAYPEDPEVEFDGGEDVDIIEFQCCWITRTTIHLYRNETEPVAGYCPSDLETNTGAPFHFWRYEYPYLEEGEFEYYENEDEDEDEDEEEPLELDYEAYREVLIHHPTDF